MICVSPNIDKPHTLDDESLGEYLKELKQTEIIIEKYNWDFEKASLCSSEWKKKVLNEIDEQIKLCEHYFKTKKRKDLFKWIFTEKIKEESWNPERDVYSFSNGLLKGVIEIFHNVTNTKISYSVKSDCDLYLYFQNKENYKNLRSEESIKSYIEETKKYLEAEISKVDYDGREKNFLDFVLNGERKNEHNTH